MNEMLVENLPNVREPATTLELDGSLIDGLPEIEDELDHMRFSARQELINTQGGKVDYVQDAIAIVRSRANGNNLLTADSLDHTGLTNCMTAHGINTDALRRAGSFRIFAKLDLDSRSLMDLEYQVRTADYNVHTFWKLSLNGLYGFVNLQTEKSTLPQPLKGKGNIAFVPGLRLALFADAKTLARNVS